MFDDCNLLQPLNSDCVQTACSSALPAGNYNSNNKKFYDLGYYTNFWSSTEHASSNAYNLNLDDYLAFVYDYGKYYGYSVRCLQD